MHKILKILLANLRYIVEVYKMFTQYIFSVIWPSLRHEMRFKVVNINLLTEEKMDLGESAFCSANTSLAEQNENERGLNSFF
jgi:hypothetical protein